MTLDRQDPRTPNGPGTPLVPVAFAPDAETAQRYVETLDRAGLEAHIRIEDGAHLAVGGSAYGPITSREPFVYPVLVSRLQHRAARRALANATSGPAAPITASSALGIGGVLLASVVLVAAAAWIRGDL